MYVGDGGIVEMMMMKMMMGTSKMGKPSLTETRKKTARGVRCQWVYHDHGHEMR